MDDSTKQEEMAGQGLTAARPTLGSKLATDDKPGSIRQSHESLSVAIHESHQLVETLVGKLQPIINTSVAVETKDNQKPTAYGVPVASWIQDQAMNVQDLNEKLRTIIQLIDI